MINGQKTLLLVAFICFTVAALIMLISHSNWSAAFKVVDAIIIIFSILGVVKLLTNKKKT